MSSEDELDRDEELKYEITSYGNIALSTIENGDVNATNKFSNYIALIEAAISDRMDELD